METSIPPRPTSANLRQAALGPKPGRPQPAGRSPAITIGLLVMPLAIAVALFVDRDRKDSELALRPSLADASHTGNTERFAGRLAGLAP